MIIGTRHLGAQQSAREDRLFEARPWNPGSPATFDTFAGMPHLLVINAELAYSDFHFTFQPAYQARATWLVYGSGGMIPAAIILETLKRPATRAGLVETRRGQRPPSARRTRR